MAKKKISLVETRVMGDTIHVEFSDGTSMAYSAEFLRTHGELTLPRPAVEIHLLKQPKTFGLQPTVRLPVGGSATRENLHSPLLILALKRDTVAHS